MKNLCCISLIIIINDNRTFVLMEMYVKELAVRQLTLGFKIVFVLIQNALEKDI